MALPLVLLVGGFVGVSAQSNSAGSGAPEALRRGEEALRANDQDAAKKFFESALKADPASAEAHANLGAIAFSHGDCATAEPHFRAALQSTPALAKVEALLAVCERRLGEPAAIADMEAAFNRLDDPKLRFQIGLELANSLYQRGDYEKTAAVLHTLLELQPDNVDVLFFAQRVYSELADATLNKLAVLSPNSARMEQLIAERLINAGDARKAIEHYRKALQLGPRLPGLHYELAETLMEVSPNDAETQKEALGELKAATDVDGDSAKAECQLGRIATLQSDAAAAAAHFQRAFAMAPDDAEAELGLADVYRLQGKPEEAAKYLRMAVKSDPFNTSAHYKLAQVDKELHLPDESKKEMQLFLDLRATQDKVKQLYREMNPGSSSAEASSKKD